MSDDQRSSMCGFGGNQVQVLHVIGVVERREGMDINEWCSCWSFFATRPCVRESHQ